MPTTVTVPGTADLAVVGGGVWGVSIAYHYARLNIGRVLLLEWNAQASAATSRAAALLTQARAKTALMPLIAQTYVDIADLEMTLGKSLDGRRVGSLHIAASASRQRELQELLAIAGQAGLPVETLTADEAAGRAPWLNPEAIMSVVFMPELGRLHRPVPAGDGLRLRRQNVWRYPLPRRGR